MCPILCLQGIKESLKCLVAINKGILLVLCGICCFPLAHLSLISSLCKKMTGFRNDLTVGSWAKRATGFGDWCKCLGPSPISTKTSLGLIPNKTMKSKCGLKSFLFLDMVFVLGGDGPKHN